MNYAPGNTSGDSVLSMYFIPGGQGGSGGVGAGGGGGGGGGGTMHIHDFIYCLQEEVVNLEFAVLMVTLVTS